MPENSRVIAEARALMACILVTQDAAEQNRLWNRYYQLSDTVFPEAAVLRKRYKGMKGAERQRFKTEYMELVRRLWLATDPGAAYDGPLSATAPPTPPHAARTSRRIPVHRWAIASVGLVALAAGGVVAWQFAQSGAKFSFWRGAQPSLDPRAEIPADPVAPGALQPDPAPEAETPPEPVFESPIDLPPPLPPFEAPMAEIEAELAAEIQPELVPVPPALKGRGDRVESGDTTYEDVYVIESDALFYVRIPGTGGVDSVQKATATYRQSTDAEGREALLDLWKQNRAAIAQAEAAREKEKPVRVAARRRAYEAQQESRRIAMEEASWRAKEKDWLALAPDQRHGARVRAYSNWQSIQADTEAVEELYYNIARTYEYIGITDSRMGRLNQVYRKLAPRMGPDFEWEDTLLVYGWGREEIMRQLAEWETEYYRMVAYLEEAYPESEARIQEIERLDASLPEKIRLAEAAPDWKGGLEDGIPERDGKSSGTGFVVAEGYVMTCAHVVRGGSVIQVTSTAGVVYNAKVETSDTANDWSLLSVKGLPGPPIPMATATPNVGATIYCLGYPLGGITDSADPIVGSGNIAALQRIDGDDRFMQITAPINPGNSGGPVLDQQGRWVGIVSQKLNDLRRLQESQTVAQGLNFAVKATFVKPLLDPRTGVKLAEAPALTRNEVISLEEITRRVSPSIVKIVVE